MSVRSILCHLDASPKSAARLRHAREVARVRGASVTALYAVTPTLLALPLAGYEGLGTALPLFESLDREQLERAREVFERESRIDGPPLAWADAGHSAPYVALQAAALCHDLLLLGQDDASDTARGMVPADLVPSAVIHGGRPALVLPHTGGPFAVMPQRVLLAWKPTREAARAASAALPWLAEASQIDLVCAPGGHGDSGSAAFPGAPEVERWLRTHGVAAPLRHHRLGDEAERSAGERLLSLAADVSAELLVMGCFGHSRAREWVLGGASRTVLRSMTLPVLMAH
jgi:nucleotide-binding universal stress UspA family protein